MKATNSINNATAKKTKQDKKRKTHIKIIRGMRLIMNTNNKKTNQKNNQQAMETKTNT